MKVVWTAAALADLDDVLAYTTEKYPSLVGPVEKRIRAIIARVGAWLESARRVEDRPEVRVVPLLRYPYRIFYKVHDESVEILHIHHTARLESDMEER
jgi:plasmid stabilization system protein ParE